MAGLTVPADPPDQLHGLLDRAAEATPDAPALREGAGERRRDRTYAELGDRVWRLAGGLRELGLQPGDRVAAWLPPGGDSVHALLSVSAAGGVFVPIDARLKAGQVRHVLADSGATMLVTRGPRLSALAKLADDLPNLKCVLGAGRSATDVLQKAQAAVPVISMSEIRASASPAAPLETRTGDDEAVVLYAGAAQGPPTGTPLSHTEIVGRAIRRAEGLDIRSDDVALSLPDPSLRPGLELLLSAVTVGAHLWPQPPLGPEELLSLAQRDRLTLVAADRSDWIRLLALPWAADAFPDLRVAVVCGGGLTETQTAELTWRLPGVTGKAVRNPRYDPGVIVVAGHPVGPDEIADRFLDTGLVAAIEVTAVDDPTTGHAIHAACTLRDLDGAESAVDPDRLRRMVARDLPDFMIPASITLQ